MIMSVRVRVRKLEQQLKPEDSTSISAEKFVRVFQLMAQLDAHGRTGEALPPDFHQQYAAANAALRGEKLNADLLHKIMLRFDEEGITA